MAQIETVAFSPATWFVVATGTHAVATATKAAVAARRHFLSGFTVSFSAIPATALTILVKSGTTVIDQIEIPVLLTGPFRVDPPRPYKALNANELVSVTVGDAGASVVGTVSIRGFTTQD